jgi:hypothetical protein
VTRVGTPQRPKKRTIPRKGTGLAQQSLVEHALCPLDASESLRAGGLHTTQYHLYDGHRNRKTATATVAAPFGLSPNDELYLYGLLALTLSQPEPSADFYATPHLCLKQLGIVGPDQEQGYRYQLFREAIRRISGVVYENDRFYDPIRQEHRQVAFGFLKYSLPLDETSSREWHFVWDQQWFRFCEAIKGSFTFDFATYRKLDVASRRLFLLLSKIFWRHDHSPAFDLRELGINTIGFSETIATKDMKQKVLRVLRTLLAADIITLPLGTADVRGLISKRSKGVYLVQLWKGAYFDRVQEHGLPFSANESPLVGPLETIGFDPKSIRRIIGRYPARLIAEWSDITLAAVERKIIKESPQAFFQHYIREAHASKATPPDWWRELRKQERERHAAEQSRARWGTDKDRFERYLREDVKDAFNNVMGRIFQQLRDDGQAEQEARRNAEHIARGQFTREFRKDHPEFADSETSSIASLLRRRIAGDGNNE